MINHLNDGSGSSSGYGAGEGDGYGSDTSFYVGYDHE